MPPAEFRHQPLGPYLVEVIPAQGIGKQDRFTMGEALVKLLLDTVDTDQPEAELAACGERQGRAR